MKPLEAGFALILAAACAGSWAMAQQTPRMPRIGVLVPGSPVRSQGLDDFREGMRALG